MSEVEGTKESCTCPKCKSACKTRPCWPTPSDAQKLIDAGYGDKLMLEWWRGEIEEEEDRDIYFLCPALGGFEEQQAPYYPIGHKPCVFFNKDELCDLHNENLKPTQGRETIHSQPESEADAIVAKAARSWDTPEGKALIEVWCKEHGVEIGHREVTEEDIMKLAILERMSKPSPFDLLGLSNFGI